MRSPPVGGSLEENFVGSGVRIQEFSRLHTPCSHEPLHPSGSGTSGPYPKPNLKSHTRRDFRFGSAGRSRTWYSSMFRGFLRFEDDGGGSGFETK
jgi:hypothetical protein